MTEEILPDAADCLPGTPQCIISNQRLLELGITLCYPTFRKEWKGSPATPKLILALIFPLIENTGQLPMPKFFWEYLRKLVYQKVL